MFIRPHERTGFTVIALLFLIGLMSQIANARWEAIIEAHTCTAIKAALTGPCGPMQQPVP